MKIFKWVAVAAVPFLLFSCSDDPIEDPVIPNEEEVITTVQLEFTADGEETARFKFYDEDGDGGIEPVLTTDTLKANTTYAVNVSFLNELDPNDVEDITEEIAEEALEHQLFFTVGSDLNLSMSYKDTDQDGNPIGLSNEAVTADASSGTFTIVLRHEPDKNAAGVKDGDAANAGGETDIEVSFDAFIR